MKYCKHCGKEMNETAAFCPFCGKQAENAETHDPGVQNQRVQNQGIQTVPIPIRNYKPYLNYQPIGMWGYFGYNILFLLHVIGWVCIILFSLGVTKNVNLRNYARSFLCIYIIMLVISIPIILSMMASGF